MSTTAAPVSDSADDEPAEVYHYRHPLAPLLATLTGLIAAAFALEDLFAHGLGRTLVHVAVGLAVFGAARWCVGASLTHHQPAGRNDGPDTRSEAS